MAEIVKRDGLNIPLKFVGGNVYKHPGYGNYYLAAFHTSGYVLVNLETGAYLFEPILTKEILQVNMQEAGMYEVPCEVHVPA